MLNVEFEKALEEVISLNCLDIQLKTILRRIAKKDDTITSLNLSNNLIGSSGPKAFQALALILKDNETITSLDLGGNEIDDACAKILADDAFKNNKTLTSLNLMSNCIGLEGVKAITEALKDNMALNLLDFSFNKIGDEGTSVLTIFLLISKMTRRYLVWL